MRTSITRKSLRVNAHMLPLARACCQAALQVNAVAARCLFCYSYGKAQARNSMCLERCLSDVFAALHRTARQLCRECCLRRCTARSSE